MPDTTVKLEDFLQNMSLENFLQDWEVNLCGVLQDAGLPYIPSDYLTKDGRRGHAPTIRSAHRSRCYYWAPSVAMRWQSPARLMISCPLD